MRWYGWAAVAASVLGPVVGTAQPLPSGEQLYGQRCAFCHETGTAGAPPKAAISQKSHDSIVETLTTGMMKPQATGLTPEEVAALASYLAVAKPELAKPELAKPEPKGR
jgi:mono/diheme cytochrome c family protein